MGNSVVRYAEVGSEENAALKRRLPCLRWCFPDPSPEEKWEYVYRRFLTEGGMLQLVEQTREPVLVALDESASALNWRSLQLVRNSPKLEGSIDVLKIKAVRPGADGEGKQVEIVWEQPTMFSLSTQDRVTTLEAETVKDRDQWLTALSQMYSVWRPQLVRTEAERRGRASRETERKRELDRRKEAREAKRRELGLDKIGMKHTAAALAGK